MLHSLVLTAAMLLSGVTSSADAPVKVINTDRLQDDSKENMLGISLPDGFEPTSDTSSSVHLLQTQCSESYRWSDPRRAPRAPKELTERFDFSGAPGTPEELMGAVIDQLVETGFSLRFVFEQFLESRGIVIAIVFSPTGEDGYYLLFDYDKRLFHPVGPCPVRPR